MKRRAVVCASIALILLRGALAVDLSHGPFDSHENRAVQLPACTMSRDIKGPAGEWHGTIAFVRDSASLALHVAAFSIDELRAYDGTNRTSTPVALEISWPDDVVDEAVCADLNDDGLTDFVVTISDHGNGLGASFYRRLIGLSANGGYRFWIFDTMDPSPEDFVRLGDSTPLALLSTTFVQSGTTDNPGPDKRHSYFAYDLWTFRGGDVVSANSVDARFPKYVLMTYAPNHKPSVRMSVNRPAIAAKPPELLRIEKR